ncbi:MAG: SEL1-like repeat protein, partial [Gammaproteobacteria bacterium]|nr:SEL1-like repeat protein [Gammaproteobacteria bacterium]
KKAASREDTKAQYNLGYMYYKGEGVPQDYAEAKKWLDKAANRENGRRWSIVQ